MTHPSPATLAARDELARLYAAPSLDAGDLARLPVLAAALGVAVRVWRVEWPEGWERMREELVIVGKVREG